MRSVANSFPCIRGLESRKGRFAENTSPLSENAKLERNSSPVKSFSPLSEDEVRVEPFAWVRSLECGKGRFVENTKNEQVWFTREILPRL